SEDPRFVVPEASIGTGFSADAEIVDEDRGGTIAFVTTSASTYVVASIAAHDEVRTFRVDANALDDDPLTVRSGGVLHLESEGPSRVIADAHGRALVALRNAGAVASIDPLRAAVVERHAVCREPNALAVHDDETYVACGSGEIVSNDDRVTIGADLREI